MCIKLYKIFSAICLGFILISGCSSGSNPITPIESDSDQILAVNTLPVGVSDYNADGNPLNGYGVLGLFEVNVDVDSLTGEVHSLRGTSSTDVLEIVDITNFLSIAPCTDCVKLMNIELNPAGNLVLNMGIRHPFATGDILKPISGQNRGDLHVFNVEGLVVAESLSSTNFPGLGVQVDDFRLLNADAYSPYLDGVLESIFPTTATVHPYKLHFDDYSAGNYDALNPMGFQSVTNPPPSGNLVMAMGSDYSIQPYEFDLSSGNLNFIFAVGCTYGVSSDSKSQRFTPVYRLPQHQKKSASEVTVRITGNNLVAGDPLSSANLAIDVVDVSHGVAIGTVLNEMVADSSVSGITIAIPGILNSDASVPLVNTGGTGHDTVDPLTFEISIQNEQSAVLGTYPGLVKIADSYMPGQNGSPLLVGNDGIERVGPTQNPLEGLFAIAEFATYQVFDIEVAGIPNDLPTAILLPDPVNIYEGQSVDWDGTTSFDTDGTIDLYEFDYDWDGVEANFTADASNTTGLVTSTSYDIFGIFTAGLRVTDNLGGVDYDSVQVEVLEQGVCTTEAHAYLSTHNISGVLSDGSFNANMVYFEAGPNTGKVLYMYRSTRLGMIDPTASDQTITPFNTTADWGANYYNAVDACPVTGRVFGAITNHANIWAPDGTSLMHWQTNDQAYITTADIDDNGDLLAMIRNGTVTTFRRFEYSASAPYYNNIAVESYDLTATYPASSGWVCIDFAIDYETDLIYMFWACWNGSGNNAEYSVAAYDFSGATANRIYERNDVFTKNINFMIGGNADGPFYGRRADMEIEHVTPERCRIVLAANTDYSGTFHYEVVRLDDQLNLIDLDDTVQVSTSIGNMPMCFTIADTPDHPMITIPMTGSTIRYFESTDW